MVLSHVPILRVLGLTSFDRAALYHFGLRDAKESFRKLKPVLFVFDGILGAAFITLLIVYFSLSDQLTITCESDIEANSVVTTPKQIVAVVYKAFFAVVCIMLSIAFLVYGSRIVQSSTSFTVVSLDRAERRAIKKRKNDIVAVRTLNCTWHLLIFRRKSLSQLCARYVCSVKQQTC